MHARHLLVCLTLAAPAALAQTGTWHTQSQHNVAVAPGFQHAPPTGPQGQRFKTLHLALIPKPSALEGLVIGWDSQGQNGSVGGWFQRWTILDPSTDPPTVLWNDELFIPGPVSGDLFCTGHAWTSDGDLMVAGGTTLYPGGGGSFLGAKMALMFSPTPTPLQPYGSWKALPDMATHRWYPTVTQAGNGMMVVSGGTHNGGPVRSYEVYDPATNTWQVDPSGSRTFPEPVSGGGSSLFWNYPRMHTLSQGQMFKSGAIRESSRVNDILVGAWTNTGFANTGHGDGASILFPLPWNIPDVVVQIGGTNGGVAHNVVEYCLPQSTPAPWTVLGPGMIKNREHINAVTLPDATVLVIGGNTGTTFWPDAEWLDNGLAWRQLATGASVRDYHSTALLLPDGKVLSAGGDNRNFDYQLFSPPYFDPPASPRPTGVTLPSTNLDYVANGAGPYTASFSLTSGSIRNVVLMAPGSTTHHSDMGQRYVDLPILTQTATSVTFYPPWDNCLPTNPVNFCAPRGYYMLFLVSDQGVPSNAVFVKF